MPGEQVEHSKTKMLKDSSLQYREYTYVHWDLGKMQIIIFL